MPIGGLRPNASAGCLPCLLRGLLGLLAFALLGLTSAPAANLYWDDVGGTLDDWGSASNWSTSSGGGGTGTIPGATDLVFFSATSVVSPQTVNLNGGRAVSGLEFTSSQAHSLLGGSGNQTLTVGTDGISKTGTGAVTIGSAVAGQQVAIALSANQTWSNDQITGAIQILNGVAASGATNRTLTLGGTSTAANTISGSITNNGGGVFSLTKSDTGLWSLSGANSYTGATTISAGVLQASNSTALGTTAGGVTVASGAALELSGGIAVGAEALSLNHDGASGGGALRNVSGDNSWAGTITLANVSTVHRINSDAGTLTLSGTITETGNRDNKDLTFGGAGNVTVTGNITASSGDMRLFKDGSGTLTLAGANAYNGATSIAAGVVNIRSATALGTAAGATTVTAGAALQLQGGITVGAEALTLNGSGISTDGALRNISGTNIYGGLVTLGGATRIQADAGTLTLSNAGTLTGATFGLSVGGAGDTRINSIIGTGSGTLTKDGAGTLTLGAVNTFTGITNVFEGTLGYGVNNALGTGAVAVIGTSAILNLYAYSDAVGAVTLGGGATLDGSGTLTGSSYSLQGATINANLGTGLATVTADTILNGLLGGNLQIGANSQMTLGSASRFTGNPVLSIAEGASLNLPNTSVGAETIASLTGAGGVNLYAGTLTVGSTSGSSTFSGSLTGTGGGLIKTGASTLILTGSNSYTGTTTISGGTLQIGAGGTTGSLGGNGNIVNNGALVFNRSNDFTVAGVISGSGSVTQAGSGTTTLTGANTYTGLTTVSAGVLNIRNATALGTTAAGTVVSTGAALQIQGGITVGAEALTLNGAGISSDGALRNISGNNTYGGLLTLGSAARINSDAGTLTLNNTGTITGAGLGLTVGGAGNTILSSIIGTGSGTLTKDGSGTLTLNGTAANTFTGLTTVNAGTLFLNNTVVNGAIPGNLTIGDGVGTDTVYVNLSGQIGNSSAVTLNPGALLDFNPAATALETIGALTMTAGTVTTATGTLFLSGNVTGNANATAATISGHLNLNANGNTNPTAVRTFTIADGAAAQDMVISAIVADGALTKTGPGTLALTGANLYTGPTTVSNGTLLVNNTSGSGTGTGTVSVASGATLTGTGTLSGATSIQAGGIHAPGTGVGIEKFGSSLTYQDDSIFTWEIDRTKSQVRGTGYDAVNVAGTLGGLDGADAGTALNAIFRIVIGDSDFSAPFWDTARTWTDIFTSADGATAKADWTNIFDRLQYYKTDGTTVSPIGQGAFGMSGNTLYWGPLGDSGGTVPEPTGALAGLLLAAGLLRRRRRVAA